MKTSTKGDKIEEIPVNLELLSNDNRVGVLLAIGCLMFGIGLSDLMEWKNFFQAGGVGVYLVRPLLLLFGGLLVVLCVQRLVIPGCKPILRINFGGVTDIRLVTMPIRWSLIVNARRPHGVWNYLLHGVILELVEGYRPSGIETVWSRLIHLPLRLFGSNLLFLECATLDISTEKTLVSIRSHLQAKQSVGRR